MMVVKEDYNIKALNTFGLDVKAKYFVEFDSEDELQSALLLPEVKNNRLLVIGRGSNLLFLHDFDGVILHSCINHIKLKDEDMSGVLLEVGSGVLWDDLVAYAVNNGWGGAENLSLIPGETGAAAVQNIGAYGAEICDIVEGVHAVEITSGDKRFFTLSECKYGYRESVFKNELKGKYIITSVILRLNKIPQFKLDYSHLKDEVLKRGDITLSNIRQTVIEIRSSKLPDPAVLGNAGSFFMNPVIPISLFEEIKTKYPLVPSYPIDELTKKVPAGWLIEQSGWKGKSLGNAGVHKNQALVLVNLGGATGDEIKILSDVIRQDVFKLFGIELTPEVNFIS